MLIKLQYLKNIELPIEMNKYLKCKFAWNMHSSRLHFRYLHVFIFQLLNIKPEGVKVCGYIQDIFINMYLCRKKNRLIDIYDWRFNDKKNERCNSRERFAISNIICWFMYREQAIVIKGFVVRVIRAGRYSSCNTARSVIVFDTALWKFIRADISPAPLTELLFNIQFNYMRASKAESWRNTY